MPFCTHIFRDSHLCCNNRSTNVTVRASTTWWNKHLTVIQPMPACRSLIHAELINIQSIFTISDTLTRLEGLPRRIIVFRNKKRKKDRKNDQDIRAMTVKDKEREKSRKRYTTEECSAPFDWGNLELVCVCVCVCVCAAEEHSPYPPPLCVQRRGKEREKKHG